MPMNVMCEVLTKRRIDESPRLQRHRLVIEDCIGESIHLHYRNLRLEFTIRDFLTCADGLAAAAEEVRRLGIKDKRSRRRGLRWAWSTLFSRR